MEGRRIFAELSVEENLRVGGYAKPTQLGEGLDRVYELFPILEERRQRRSPGTSPAASSRCWPSGGR